MNRDEDFYKRCYEELRARIEFSAKVLDDAPDPFGMRSNTTAHLRSLLVGVEEVVESKTSIADYSLPPCEKNAKELPQ